MNELYPEKRSSDRYTVSVSVQCRPLGSKLMNNIVIEMWTRDAHPEGVGLMWSSLLKPRKCPECALLVRDLVCDLQYCPYRTLRNSLQQDGWFQIHGLEQVPGWENEKKVLGQVIWFQPEKDESAFQAGIKFYRERPGIISDKNEAEKERMNKMQNIFGELLERQSTILSNYDIQRWQQKLQESARKVLIIDQDRINSVQILSAAKASGFTGEIATTVRSGLLASFFERPTIAFLNPVFHDSLKMGIVEAVKRNNPKVHLILLVEEKFKDAILEDPRMKLVNRFLVKPLDLPSLKDLFQNVPEKMKMNRSQES